MQHTPADSRRIAVLLSIVLAAGRPATAPAADGARAAVDPSIYRAPTHPMRITSRFRWAGRPTGPGPFWL